MLEILQQEVDDILKEEYYIGEEHKVEDEKTLTFTLSILIGDARTGKGSHKIVLTINHHGEKLSRIIFPKKSQHDYLTLKEEMMYLYNATM